MWNWKPAKAMLERLWNHGDLVIAGRQGFQRVYDLTERVIPRAQLEAPVPSRRRGAADARRAGGARPRRVDRGGHRRSTGGCGAASRASGRPWPSSSRRAASAGCASTTAAPDVLVAADAELDRPPPRAAVLLSPFDNLLWDRPFARRILGFDHLIEVYKPAPQRQYGYYVLPFLRGDRIVGRADLKSERKEGAPRRPRLPPRGRRPRLGRARRRSRHGARPARPLDRARGGAPVKVSLEEARRIAVRAQLLDGSAKGVLSTVRRLGFLQIDVVQPVERAAAPRPLQPARPDVRPRGARPAAVGGALALRVGRVHLPARGPAARSRADPQLPAFAADQEPAVGARVPDDEPCVSPLRDARARAARAAPLPRARGPLGRREARQPVVGTPAWSD